MKKAEVSKFMSELSRRRWRGKTAEERSEAARKAGLGNAKLSKAKRRSRASNAAKSITPAAARARALKAAETRRKNREAAEAEEFKAAAVEHGKRRKAVKRGEA